MQGVNRKDIYGGGKGIYMWALYASDCKQPSSSAPVSVYAIHETTFNFTVKFGKMVFWNLLDSPPLTQLICPGWWVPVYLWSETLCRVLSGQLWPTGHWHSEAELWGLLPVTAFTFQVVPEHLCAVLLWFLKAWDTFQFSVQSLEGPGMCVVVVFLIVKHDLL